MNRPAWNRLEPWDRLERRRLTRRALLSRSARLGLGAAGLALVGCGGGDDDEEERSAATTAPAPVEEEPAAVTQAEPEQEQEQEPEPAPAPEPEPQPQPEAEGMMAAEVTIIESLRLDGLDGAVTLRNMSPDPVDLSGWWFCQRPNYWPFPDIVLQPGQRLLINAGPGDNTADTFFGNGAFGSLSGSGGELALYRSGGLQQQRRDRQLRRLELRRRWTGQRGACRRHLGRGHRPGDRRRHHQLRRRRRRRQRRRRLRRPVAAPSRSCPQPPFVIRPEASSHIRAISGPMKRNFPRSTCCSAVRSSPSSTS